MNSIFEFQYLKMDNIFLNSENSKASDTYRLLFNRSDKVDLKKSDKYVAPLSLSIIQKQ